MSHSVALDAVAAKSVVAFSPRRWAGITGLAFALFVGLLNVFLASLAPPAMDAQGSDIVAFVAENRTVLAVALGMVPAGIFLLFMFIAGAYPVLSKASPAAAFWTRLGAVGVVLVEIMFLTRTLPEVVLVANVDSLANDHLLVETLWQLQGASMAANGLALAVTLLGLSRAARLSGLIPAWQEMMGLAAAVAFVVASVAVVPSLSGTPIGILALPAFVAWLVWLGITSSRLLRDDPAAS
jgi:hypothetical protein